MNYSCLRDYGFKQKFNKVLDPLHLPKIHRTILNERYVSEVANAEKMYLMTTIIYFLLSNLITVGSVLVVTFISVDKIAMVPSDVQAAFFWAGWSLSVVVVIANKLLYSFNLQKKYILDKAALEKFRSEGWSYVSGINRYNGLTPVDSFNMFMSRIEKLRLKIVQNSLGGDNSAKSILQTASSTDNIYPYDFMTAGAPTKVVNTNNTAPVVTADNIAERDFEMVVVEH